MPGSQFQLRTRHHHPAAALIDSSHIKKRSTNGRPLSFVKFEVPQRQQLQSIHRLLNVPPCSNRQTGQRVSVREIRYRKQPPTVRNTRAVLKKASWGTRCIFGSIRCKKQAFPVRDGYSVPKTASSGTRRIFKSAKRPPLGGEQT